MKDDLLAPDRKPPPGTIPLFSPIHTTFEGKSDLLPCETEPTSVHVGAADLTNLVYE